MPDADAARQAGGPEMGEPARALRIQPAEQGGCGRSCGELHAPVDDCQRRRDAAGDEESERDGRVEMTARNVSDGGDHDGDRNSIGEGDADEGQAAVDVERLRVHDRGRQCLRDGED